MFGKTAPSEFSTGAAPKKRLTDGVDVSVRDAFPVSAPDWRRDREPVSAQAPDARRYRRWDGETAVEAPYGTEASVSRSNEAREPESAAPVSTGPRAVGAEEHSLPAEPEVPAAGGSTARDGAAREDAPAFAHGNPTERPD